jgi:hypothetical protein
VIHTETDTYWNWYILILIHTDTDTYWYRYIQIPIHTDTDTYWNWYILKLIHTDTDTHWYWYWYINLTVDGAIYRSQHFPFGAAFVCQDGNFWTLPRNIDAMANWCTGIVHPWLVNFKHFSMYKENYSSVQFQITATLMTSSSLVFRIVKRYSNNKIRTDCQSNI